MADQPDLDPGPIRERLRSIEAAIEAERAASPCAADSVTIVAVTKGHGARRVREAAAAGLKIIGENRVQEAREKAVHVPDALNWHLIGHLQRNKARQAAELFDTIHSVDSERLIDALAATGKRLGIFLQVNVSGEDSKFGVRPDAVDSLLRRARNAENLQVLGLMTMAPASKDAEAAAPHFRALRLLRNDLNGTPRSAGDGPPLRFLSMGMSSDYLVAVREGATHVRIGTALIGGRGTIE
ncbi:MAG: YggS family pyridoxal phosphate-dependent enzyme [Planctomycetota bacterium]